LKSKQVALDIAIAGMGGLCLARLLAEQGHRADAESGQTDFAVMRLDVCNWGRK